MSRYAILLGLVGVYVGILGLIIAAGSPELSKQSGNVVYGASFIWMLGLLFFLGAYFEARKPD